MEYIMKKVSMFDVSNPLNEEQQLEIDAGAGNCYCSCRGKSSNSSNSSANNSSDLSSCSCYSGSDPISQLSYSVHSSGLSVYC